MIVTPSYFHNSYLGMLRQLGPGPHPQPPGTGHMSEEAAAFLYHAKGELTVRGCFLGTTFRYISALAALSPFSNFSRSSGAQTNTWICNPGGLQVPHNQEIMLPMFLMENSQEVSSLDIRHTLKAYVDATAGFRKSDHLFIIPKRAQKGLKASSRVQRLIVGEDRPLGLQIKRLACA